MRKAKIKKRKEYLSIMLIPHSQDRVRVIKISSFYFKVSLLFAALLIFVSGLIVMNIKLSNRNKSLESHIEGLSRLNVEQKNMIDEKAIPLKTLRKEKSQLMPKSTNLQKNIKIWQRNIYRANPAARPADRTTGQKEHLLMTSQY